MYTHSEINGLVHGPRVDKRVYTEQDIFDLEMERIFAGAWTYMGHESQIPEPGCYVTTDIGTQPLILVRDEHKRLRVFYNRCTHRGAKIVVNASGRISKFVCNFHSYSFNADGSIAGIPLEDTYDGSGHGRCNSEMNLREVPDVESYRGFIFVRLKHGTVDLADWLGDAAATIDNFVDRAPDGCVEVVGRPYRWVNHCNWKMLVENIVDGAHVGGTHPSIGQTGTTLANEYRKKGQTVPPILEMARSFWQPNQFIRDMGLTVLPNGHSYNGGRLSIHSDYSEVPGYIEAMEEAYGKQRSKEILSHQRHNTCIYPNLHMKSMIQKIRIFKPLAPDKTVVECWAFRLKGAPAEMLQWTLTYAEMLDSPATLVSTDDVEVMMRMQAGLKADAEPMVNMYRGLKRREVPTGDALYCEGDSERPFIRQFDVWKKLMCEEVG